MIRAYAKAAMLINRNGTHEIFCRIRVPRYLAFYVLGSGQVRPGIQTQMYQGRKLIASQDRQTKLTGPHQGDRWAPKGQCQARNLPWGKRQGPEFRHLGPYMKNQRPLQAAGGCASWTTKEYWGVRILLEG